MGRGGSSVSWARGVGVHQPERYAGVWLVPWAVAPATWRPAPRRRCSQAAGGLLPTMGKTSESEPATARNCRR